MGVIILAGNTGLVYTLLQTTKEMHVRHEGSARNNAAVLADSEGSVVAVSEAAENVPLLVAPLLTFRQLDQMKTLGAVDYHTGSVEQYSTVGFSWFSQTHMIFHTIRGDEIHIKDAASWIQKPDGDRHFTCTNNVRCAAFRLAGVDTEVLTEQMMTILYANNTEADDA